MVGFPFGQDGPDLDHVPNRRFAGFQFHESAGGDTGVPVSSNTKNFKISSIQAILYLCCLIAVHHL
jgi:hypothetical protein